MLGNRNCKNRNLMLSGTVTGMHCDSGYGGGTGFRSGSPNIKWNKKVKKSNIGVRGQPSGK
jgi:hypothetical protein